MSTRISKPFTTLFVYMVGYIDQMSSQCSTIPNILQNGVLKYKHYFKLLETFIVSFSNKPVKYFGI